MSAATAPARRRAADLGRRERAHLAALTGVGDVRLGVRLLRGVPTNEARPSAVLTQVSERAQAFGRELATAPSGGERFSPQVRERTDGLASRAPAVARYLPRQGRVELFTDVIQHCEDVVDALGWRHLYPPGSLRAAALLHEQAHELICHGRGAALRRATGVVALRLGRYVRWAHVAAADELAAHAFAQARLGLERSPLLVTLAAAGVLEGDDLSTAPSTRPSSGPSAGPSTEEG